MSGKKKISRSVVCLFICLMLCLAGCSSADDVTLGIFKITLAEFQTAISTAVNKTVPKFRVIRDELDSYIYKCSINDTLSLVIYRSSDVNAADVIFKYMEANDEEFTDYAKVLGTVIMMLDPNTDIDILIENLGLGDFTPSTQTTFQNESCAYEYSVYDEQLIFSIYKQAE